MKRLNKYFKKRFKNLETALRSYHHIQDPQVLHQIRVEIKKIKVLLNLFNFSINKFKAHRHFIPLRTIFRQAGKIREPDVMYTLLLQYHINGIGDEQIPNAKKLSASEKIFQKRVPQFIEVVRTQYSSLAKYLKRISKTEIKEYQQNRKRKLKRLLFPVLQVKTLHKARKIDKEIMYQHDLAGNSKLDPFYNEVETIIGQWHDKQMVLPIVRKKKAVDDMRLLKTLCSEDVARLRELTMQHYNHS